MKHFRFVIGPSLLATALICHASGSTQKEISGVWARIKTPTYAFDKVTDEGVIKAAFRANQKVGAKKVNAQWVKVYLDNGTPVYVTASDVNLSTVHFTSPQFKKFVAAHTLPPAPKDVANCIHEIKAGNRSFIPQLAQCGTKAIPYIARELAVPNELGESSEAFEEALYYFGPDAKPTVLDLLKNGSLCEQAAGAWVVADNSDAVGDYNRPWRVDKVTKDPKTIQGNLWVMDEDVLAAMRSRISDYMAAEPVVKFLTAIDDRKSYAAYLKMSSSDHIQWAVDGLLGLAPLSKDDEMPALQAAVDRIVRIVNNLPEDQSTDTMRRVLDAIAMGRPTGCTKMLLDLYKKEPTGLKFLFAAAFRERGDPATADAVVELVKDQTVGETAVSTLGEFRDPKYFTVIYDYIAIGDELHKMIGIQALGFTQSPDVVDTIIKYGKDSDVQVRMAVVEALANIPADKATEALKQMKNDSEQGIRDQVEATLSSRNIGLE